MWACLIFVNRMNLMFSVRLAGSAVKNEREMSLSANIQTRVNKKKKNQASLPRSDLQCTFIYCLPVSLILLLLENPSQASHCKYAK